MGLGSQVGGRQASPGPASRDGMALAGGAALAPLPGVGVIHALSTVPAPPPPKASYVGETNVTIKQAWWKLEVWTVRLGRGRAEAGLGGTRRRTEQRNIRNPNPPTCKMAPSGPVTAPTPTPHPTLPPATSRETPLLLQPPKPRAERTSWSGGGEQHLTKSSDQHPRPTQRTTGPWGTWGWTPSLERPRGEAAPGGTGGRGPAAMIPARLDQRSPDTPCTRCL